MTEATSGKARLLAALDVRQHLRYGIAVGGLVAAAIYLLFVAGNGPLTTQLLYLLLTIVLALSTAAVVTTVLVGAEAYKLAVEESPADSDTNTDEADALTVEESATDSDAHADES